MSSAVSSAASSAARLAASQLRSSPQISCSSAAIRSRSWRRPHGAQRQAGRRPRLSGDGRGGGDHDGLGLVRLEAGVPQALAEVGGQIVAVQLPLERFSACRERLDLPRDQGVEGTALEAAEVAVDDEAAAVEPEEAMQRPVALAGGAGRKARRVPDAQPRVVGLEQLRSSRHTSRRAPARTIERRASVRSPMSSPSTSAGSGASQRTTASSMSWT